MFVSRSLLYSECVVGNDSMTVAGFNVQCSAMM